MGAAVSLGEVACPHDDASYTGEVSNSTFSMDYVRSRVREYQTVLDALDRGYRAALDVRTRRASMNRRAPIWTRLCPISSRNAGR
jgi:hypothetical protein